MNVLLSIKPRYVEAILRGEKTHEFRKALFKRNDVERVYIYASSPVKKVIGYFTIERIIRDHPKELWKSLYETSGLKKEEFFKYFGTRETGFAIEIDKLEVFRSPIDPKILNPAFTPPQSYCYTDQWIPEVS